MNWWDETADIVIAGAGSAGATLAARLSENPALKVLLLEAGGSDRHLMVDMPAGSFALMGNKKLDWNYGVEPDPSINGRSPTWSGGRMLGGSSSMNGMVYVRGQRDDYARWEMAGATGWGWDQILPYFRKATPSQVHGSHGPLKVAPGNVRHPLTDPVRDAFVALGIPHLDEYCAGDQYGVYDILTTAAGGRRRSTARTYLKEARGRPNLRIVTDVLVDKVLIENGCAVGLRVLHAGVPRVVAAREVVVSSGTIGSPAILMRSGIGPEDMLADKGIRTVADLPVGRNLQEHCGISVSKLVTVATYNSPFGPYTIARDFLHWILTRRGPMASAAVHLMAGTKSDPALVEPDLSYSFIPLAIDLSSGRPAMHSKPGISIGGLCMRPDSRGRIGLRSADPMDKPLIEHRLLGDRRDVDRLIKVGQFLERLYATPALAPFVVAPNHPNPVPVKDEEWEAYVRRSASFGYHSVGTCAMGGPEAVLDPQLRVRKIGGLRVVDASVMPTIVSGNTNAATIAIAEKAADLIRTDYRKAS